MAIKVKLTLRGGARRFPATYDVDFIGTPKTGEIAKKRKKVQDDMKADKKAQERKGLATPVFKLDFKWTRKKGKAIRYKLVVKVVRDKRFKPPGGGGTDVPPKPKNPQIPPA